MKGIDIFCASQASTAICMSMEQASCSSSSAIQLGGRAIDRHNPIIRDARRSARALSAPCSAEPPINPKPYHQLQRTKKSSSSKPSDPNKKSSTKSSDQKKKSVARPTDLIINKHSSQPTDVIKKNWSKQVELITPPGSSRYLLSDTAYFDGLSDYDKFLELVPAEEKKKTEAVNKKESTTASKPSSSSSSNSSSSDQVRSQSLLICMYGRQRRNFDKAIRCMIY